MFKLIIELQHGEDDAAISDWGREERECFVSRCLRERSAVLMTGIWVHAVVDQMHMVFWLMDFLNNGNGYKYSLYTLCTLI